jgi:hypothetical protein
LAAKEEQLLLAGGMFRTGRSSLPRLLRVFAAALALHLAGTSARAQGGVNPEYEALFRRVLREPANLDLSFRFAEMATRAGDYEAAIGALERMLFYKPDLPRVKLELAILYFRLGSYEMARSYFQGALAAGAPPEVTARVQPFLVEIDRRLSTTQWSAFGQIGTRYQTNANAGPTSALVRGAGFDVILDKRFVKRPDWNAFGLMAIRHIHDFENQRGTSGRRTSSATPPASSRSTGLISGLRKSRRARGLRFFPMHGSALRYGPMWSELPSRSGAIPTLEASAAAFRSVCRSPRADRAFRRDPAAAFREHAGLSSRQRANRATVDGRRSRARSDLGLRRTLAGPRGLRPQ